MNIHKEAKIKVKAFYFGKYMGLLFLEAVES